MIKKGTNRISFIGKDFVYKIAIGYRGYAANLQEYINSLNNDLVAKTELKWYGLKQEKLNNIYSYNRYEVKKNIKKEHLQLFDIKLNNKLQVGQDKNGKWKIFDYEDIKYYTRKENLK